jgi:uncharacterized membrane protein YphA (DoxX/SURF4 family)
MKFLVQFSRIFVGCVFIFSGLIKLNDPIGTQLKLEEYFEVFATDFPWMAGFWEALVPFALVFSVVLCSLEVILGVALLLRFRLKATAWILFGLCAFFGFLTFYSAYYNKVTDCGCFGEFIKLKPWQSFWKDMILLFFIIIILLKHKLISDARTGTLMAVSALACVVAGLYAIRYLPFYDGLPYAIGQNIPANMQPPQKPQFKYLMEKNGKVEEFTDYPTDSTYKFKEMVLLNPDDVKPRITDYNLSNEQGDFTQQSFQGNKLVVVIPVVKKADASSIGEIWKLNQELKNSKVEMLIATADTDEAINNFRHEHQLGIPSYRADMKVLKTIVRSSPGLWLVSNGTVKGKWSAHSVPTAKEVLGQL